MSDTRLTRRALIAGVGGAALAGPVLGQKLIDLGLPGGPSLRPLEPQFPGKGAMIVQRIRPPLLETPIEVFAKGTITPNDCHFVRWNWAMPTEVSAAKHRVAVGGAVKAPVSLTLDEIASAGETVEIIAINQCAGNGRGLSEPRVTGTQWGNSAMGCTKWTGVRLRDVLAKAGVAGEAKGVGFAGLDVPMTDGAPQIIKSIPMDIAMRDDVLVAWAMNDEPLSILHGFPLRIVVPGWFSTYWVKMLSTIEVLTGEDESHYVAETYRWPTVTVKPGDNTLPDDPIDLPEGAGREAVIENCTACHSPSTMLQQPKVPREKWEASVAKMIALYKAPVDPKSVPQIVDYMVAIQARQSDVPRETLR